MINRRSTVMCLAGFLGVARPAWTQVSAQPMRIVVPTGPGTGSDATARFVAQALGASWQMPVVVDNKMGAGGVIGTDFVAKAPADGRTLLLTYASHYTNQWLGKTPYDAVADFEPVARIASSALVLVTAADSPLRSVADVIAAARLKPQALSYGSSGTGSTSHMSGALLAHMAHLQFNHVPYKAPGQVAIDAASGQVDTAFGGVATFLPMIRSGRLRALAVTTAVPSQHLPNVPPMAASGLAGYDVSTPIWVFAPRGTSPGAVARLSQALTRMAATAEFGSFCLGQGLDVDIQDAATAKASAPAELEKWRQLVALTTA
ncbi:tripartite tricarboxylate transporter substrate binding protein [Xylophilus sp. ASV27]|uniref:tripartite tricarboxylate transporter substrate binding protein n=1 Tax=Xylophilus sp. ASV27 TaxID=2795129 RepID=UPI0018EC527A|nr:tripartite tricarboxylate transporter substrate binding protein [Xylophilus sp. ASV27]